MNKSCKECKYFKEIQDSNGRGNCRRYPPCPVFDIEKINTPFGNEKRAVKSVMAVYPIVSNEYGCGEYITNGNIG